MKQSKVLLTLNEEKVREGIINRLLLLEAGASVKIKSAEYDGFLFFEVVVDVENLDDVLGFMGVIQREMPEVTVMGTPPTAMPSGTPRRKVLLSVDDDEVRKEVLSDLLNNFTPPSSVRIEKVYYDGSFIVVEIQADANGTVEFTTLVRSTFPEVFVAGFQPLPEEGSDEG